MLHQKRSFGEAFLRKKLNSVKILDYYVETTVYKVLKNLPRTDMFDVRTTQNQKAAYGESIITEAFKSASMFNTEEKLTKTELIQLFSVLSINEVWSAEFHKQETDGNWQEELISKIQGMHKDEAVKYMKNEFATFGKVVRKMRGQKLTLTSNNNYYLVRDLDVYFDGLEKSSDVITAEKKSIRNLDMNTIQNLIFNNVKYILK